MNSKISCHRGVWYSITQTPRDSDSVSSLETFYDLRSLKVNIYIDFSHAVTRISAKNDLISREV